MNRRSFVRNVAYAIVGVATAVYAPGVARWSVVSTKAAYGDLARVTGDVTADGGFILPKEVSALICEAMERHGYLEMPQHEPT